MPEVDGQQFAYTPAGRRAAAAARRSKGNPGARVPKPRPSVLPRPARAPRPPMARPMGNRLGGAPKTKSSLMGKGYNFTRNLGDITDKLGY